MRILILGGTSFVGRAIVTDALAHGVEVTLFHRGRTGTALFPDVERRIGDRDTGDYTALRHGTWDAVVDTTGYVPRHVDQASTALDDRVGRYLFISSNAVYTRADVGPDSDEDTPLRPADRSGTEELTEDTYGPLKVACEQDVRTRYGNRATIVRPGKIAGPHDPQDTFTYWVRRAACGGRVALPGDPAQPVQVLDVRDLGRFVVRLLTDDQPGTFHAVGPAEPTTLADLIHTCATVAGTRIDLVPVDPAAVAPFFPLVRADWSTQQRSPARARAAGLPATPLAVTAADTLAWDRARGEPPLSCGLTAPEEARLLTGT
ncbi:NAD-dependent epimerase/dehydratase family protein [Plantactinospora sp. GCM10030261]|uniref:NAD-dependent epimerase/dehydratase family protein n=1 Tax=Plantactinospora sp. GCM10030261 TaxID=3273420 RepID=UPI00360CADD6